jgi:hypothetical protein
MRKAFSWLALAGIFIFCGFSGLLAAEKKQSISLEAPPQAQILKVDYYLKFLKEFGEGKPAMHVEVKIKNLSDKAERFSVMVSTPDGDSAAAFLPEKAKKEGALPVLEPREEGKITLPLLVEKLADSFTVTVELVPAE